MRQGGKPLDHQADRLKFTRSDAVNWMRDRSHLRGHNVDCENIRAGPGDSALSSSFEYTQRRRVGRFGGVYLPESSVTITSTVSLSSP